MIENTGRKIVLQHLLVVTDEKGKTMVVKHSIAILPTPTGWVHWQDNLKMGPHGPAPDAKLVPLVQESVVNSYVRDGGYDVAAADAYRAASKDYWTAVRSAWAEAIARDKGVHVAEVAETGSASGERLMGFAEDVQAGKLTTPAAVAKARAVIAESRAEPAVR